MSQTTERHRLNRSAGNGGAYMEPSVDGNWVRFTDHVQALAAKDAELARLTARVKELEQVGRVLGAECHTSRVLVKDLLSDDGNPDVAVDSKLARGATNANPLASAWVEEAKK